MKYSITCTKDGKVYDFFLESVEQIHRGDIIFLPDGRKIIIISFASCFTEFVNPDVPASKKEIPNLKVCEPVIYSGILINE